MIPSDSEEAAETGSDDAEALQAVGMKVVLLMI